MSYLNQFVDALKYSAKLNKEYSKLNPNFNEIYELLQSYQVPEAKEYYDEFIKAIEKLANTYLIRREENNLQNTSCCHVVSHNFIPFYNNSMKEVLDKKIKPPHMDITIGEVTHKGTSLYNVSKSSIKKIINAGFQPDETLDVHVWLTLENMTVIDLTIMRNLHIRGSISDADLKEKPVIIWRDDKPSALHYTPLLIDNDFLNKVDRVSKRILY